MQMYALPILLFKKDQTNLDKVNNWILDKISQTKLQNIFNEMYKKDFFVFPYLAKGNHLLENFEKLKTIAEVKFRENKNIVLRNMEEQRISGNYTSVICYVPIAFKDDLYVIENFKPEILPDIVDTLNNNQSFSDYQYLTINSLIECDMEEMANFEVEFLKAIKNNQITEIQNRKPPLPQRAEQSVL